MTSLMTPLQKQGHFSCDFHQKKSLLNMKLDLFDNQHVWKISSVCLPILFGTLTFLAVDSRWLPCIPKVFYFYFMFTTRILSL